MKSMNCTYMTDSTQKSSHNTEVNILLARGSSGVHP